MNAAVLLSDPSPILRQRVLQDLLAYPTDDPEVRELQQLIPEDPLLAPLTANQLQDGSWDHIPGPGSVKTDKLSTTVALLKRLGFLGLNRKNKTVSRAADYVFSKQRKDGSWPLRNYSRGLEENEGYTMIPLQTAMPLRALAMCGYTEDPRSEQAYAWLMKQQLADGTWPTGIAGGIYGGVGGYRRMPHSRWGCRTNSTEVLCCLALHPVKCKENTAGQLLDKLLGRETKDRYNLGFTAARLAGYEPEQGYLTYHARFDPGLTLELCWRLGADRSDARVNDLVRFISDQQSEYGLWEYLRQPAASCWVTYYLLGSLMKITAEGHWLSRVPPVHFRPYPKRKRRY